MTWSLELPEIVLVLLDNFTDKIHSDRLPRKFSRVPRHLSECSWSAPHNIYILSIHITYQNIVKRILFTVYVNQAFNADKIRL